MTIRDIALNLKKGSSPCILPSSAGSLLQACIDPSFNLLRLHAEIFSRFLDTANYPGGPEAYRESRSTGANFWGMLFKSVDVYVAVLIIPMTWKTEFDCKALKAT